MIQMNLFTKQKHREPTYGSQEESVGVGGGIEFGINMHILLYLKWITDKDLLFSTGNSAQYSVIT